MIDKQLKLIYEYMGWNWDRVELEAGVNIAPDSNTAWEVVQEMERRQSNGVASHYDLFILFALEYWQIQQIKKPSRHFELWLYNPKNFFGCFTKWLEDKKKSKIKNLKD